MQIGRGGQSGFFQSVFASTKILEGGSFSKGVKSAGFRIEVRLGPFTGFAGLSAGIIMNYLIRAIHRAVAI